MDGKLQQKIMERYPLIFCERQMPLEVTAMCWGIETGDGWYDLIDALCATLQHETDSADAPQIVVTQVKEKFGGLRFYVRMANDRQFAMIDEAEEMSQRVCEDCGKPGKLRSDGWMATRCGTHATAG